LADAARLETLGAREVTLVWRGRPVTIPLRVEDWPTEDIRKARFIHAVKRLLGGQRVGPAVIDDYRLLSDAMAETIGVGRLPETPAAPDAWFGGLPTLLRLLHENEDDIAADLRERFGVDYRDRWRDALTLREIWVMIRRSPSTSAIALADNYGKHVWTEPDFIGAGIYQALTGEIYPGRPLKPAEMERAIEAMRAKAAHVDKLKSRQAHYGQAATPPPTPQSHGAVNALAEATANRRRELGISEE
jgi:hypothetical protein